MNTIKNYLFSFLYIIASVLIFNVFITLFNYFNILPYKTLNILRTLVIIISILIGSFILGRKSSKNGYLEGLKFGAIFIIFILIFSFLGFDKSFEFKKIIYYAIILITSMLGSMLGINKKVTNDNS